MDIKLFLDKVLIDASNISVSEGKILCKSKAVSNITSKNINNIYHIYSKVADKSKEYSCHIQFDLQKHKVHKTQCSCEIYEEFSKYKKNYVCKHISATIFQFYLTAKRKLGKAINKPKEVNSLNKELNLKLELKEIKAFNESTYEVVLKTGIDKIYTILNVPEFLDSVINKKIYRINSEFLYNPNNMIFHKNHEELLIYIHGLIKKRQCTIKDNKIIVLPNYFLRELLSYENHNKDISIIYDLVKYETLIKKENIPLSFTLKVENNNLIITSKKKLPQPLNNDFNIFLVDRNIYLPDVEQTKLYIRLWEQLKIYKYIKVEGDLREINSILNLLKEISSQIQIREEAIKFLRRYWKIDLSVNMNSPIKCNIYINYLNKKINTLDKNAKDFYRDFYYESIIIMNLERYKFIKEKDCFKFIGNDEELYLFLSEGIEQLKSKWNISFVNSTLNSTLINSTCAQCTLSENEYELKFHYELNDVGYAEYPYIQNALNDGQKFYKTKSNKILDLKDLGIKRYFYLLNHLNNSDIYNGNEIIDENKLFFIDSISEKMGFINNRCTLEERINNMKDSISEIHNTPKDFNGVLRTYQIDGVNFFRYLSKYGFGGVLADEMGLGKTIQVISFLTTIKFDKVLIIAPTSLIYNWYEEIKRFAPLFRVSVVHGNKNKRTSILNSNSYDILLTTYGTLKNDMELYNTLLFDYCILDEAQNIKNYKSQNSINTKKIKAKVKFALTGTPLENNILELWSIFDYIMPGYLYDITKFKELYYSQDKEVINELKLLINPFILRRLKSQVLSELPDKIEKKIYVKLNSKEKKEYENYLKQVKENLIGGNLDKITILSYITRLRQICQDPYLINKNYNGESSKINLALEIINECIDKEYKIIVFSQYTSILKKLQIKLKNSKIECSYIDGAIDAKERIKLVDDFNVNDINRVFLISLKAGGTGLNLTSANMVLHMDPWWNPSIEDQATDRAHRIGQKNNVEVIKLIAKDTIEEKIINLQEEKRQLINLVLNNDDFTSNNIGKLSNDEILDLFK